MSEPAEPSLIILGRRGRQPRAETRSVTRTVRLSPEEIRRMEAAATANRQDVSQFIRDAIVTAAEDCLESIS